MQKCEHDNIIIKNLPCAITRELVVANSIIQVQLYLEHIYIYTLNVKIMYSELLHDSGTHLGFL